VELANFHLRKRAAKYWLMLGVLLLAAPLPGIAAAEKASTSPVSALQSAEALYRAEGPEAALPVFEELAQKLEGTGDVRSEAIAIGFVGEIHWRLGEYDKSRQYLEQALAMKRVSGDRLQEGRTLNVLGLLHWDLGDFEQAQAYFHQGNDIAAELGDRRLQGAILNNLSLVHDELGDYYVSLAQYRRVLDLYQEADFLRGEGDTLGNIGGVYLLLGRFDEALDYYQRALAISQQLDSAIAMSQDHGNVALARLGLGEVDVALTHFDEAIALAESAGMRQDVAYWLSNKGNAVMLLGRYDEGLELHRAALERYGELDGRTEKIETLHDMGGLYQALGDLGGAERYYQQSMELAQAVGVSRAVTNNLLALGELHELRGAYELAGDLYRDAIERARESGEMAAWCRGQLLLSGVLSREKQFASATESAQRALQLAREIGAPAMEARALFSQAELRRQSAQPAEALGLYLDSLALLRSAPDADLEWQVHYGNGLAQSDLGQTADAIVSLENAVRLIESARERLQQERFRAGYIQDKYQVYVDLVRLQLEAGRREAAFSTAERLRSRSYLDLVESRLAAAPQTADERQEYELKERIRTLRQALSDEQQLPRPEQRQPAIHVYTRELLDAERAYQAFLDERGVTRPRRGGQRVPSYADVRSRLGEDEALLEYVVGQDQLMAFLLTRDRLRARVIPLHRHDLANKVELVRNLVGRRDDEHWKKPAASLSSFLLEPLNELDGKEIRHLYLVPHGTLNYLPFALLPLAGDADRRVVESYTLAYLPTAAALLGERGAPDTAGMLAMAPRRARLQHAGDEARAIGQLFAAGSKALVGAAATESFFKREAARYRMLHLATHGYFNKFNPMLSGLELEADESNDGQLELHEILGMRLTADLVTLSACQTALGGGHFAQIPAGDDFVGLTRAFLHAGSSSVMATLWEVDDASTLQLMKQFYGALAGIGDRKDKAAALASAQRALLSSTQFNHPYYWAPFVLVGETDRGPGKRT
jgi:CHAT domain-containing protein/Tfp pilus assembly protein PilF